MTTWEDFHWLYLAGAPKLQAVKVGITESPVVRRLSLRYYSREMFGNEAQDLEFICLMPVSGSRKAHQIEKYLLKQFGRDQLTGEWLRRSFAVEMLCAKCRSRSISYSAIQNREYLGGAKVFSLSDAVLIARQCLPSEGLVYELERENKRRQPRHAEFDPGA